MFVAGTHMLIPFVAKCDSDGNQLWIDDFDSGGPSAFAYAVAVDHEGNVVVVGEVNGKIGAL